MLSESNHIRLQDVITIDAESLTEKLFFFIHKVQQTANLSFIGEMGIMNISRLILEDHFHMVQKFVEKGKYVTFNFKPYEVEYIEKLNSAEREKKSIESDAFYQAINHDRLVLPPQIKDIGYVEDEMNFLDYKLLSMFLKLDHPGCVPPELDLIAVIDANLKNQDHLPRNKRRSVIY